MEERDDQVGAGAAGVGLDEAVDGLATVTGEPTKFWLSPVTTARSLMDRGDGQDQRRPATRPYGATVQPAERAVCVAQARIRTGVPAAYTPS
ncbi:hypothetical protein AB0945_14230 [Streptomyces sp. NPDC005474]|uniref:hypothetical protein n=1 Tax=Streptomyces sp. NPDC005474 TaxID=3154878 RepID=UPI003456AC23